MGLSTERALNLLRVIEKAEEISQRELAEQVEVSLGTANQTIRALVGAGILETNVRRVEGQAWSNLSFNCYW